jgi:uroporphyrinogen-III synthase
MITSVAKASFNGLRVLSLESRRATEIATLISTFGGRPTVAPALRELPRSSNAEALAFGAALVKGEVDAVVFLTGVGARALLNVVEPDQSRAAFIAALTRTKVIARGPKPVAVLREWHVPIWVTAPEPNTWRELLAAVDARFEELPANPRVAVQEYGVANPELLDGLRVRGAVVTRVPVYQWALPEDLGPLKQAATALAKAEIDVALFTTGVQIVHLFSVATSMGIGAQVKAGLARAVIASIGPTTSDEVRRRGLSVDLEASHPKMGVLVTDAAARAEGLLEGKLKGRH